MSPPVTTLKASNNIINRIIGLDMHPDVFAAAALENKDADQQKLSGCTIAKRLRILKNGPLSTYKSETFSYLKPGNSFEIASRLHALGYIAIVLESAQAAKVRENFCNDDRHSAIKLARVYLSGLAKVVWQPDEATRQLREVFFLHRSMVSIRSFLNELRALTQRDSPFELKNGHPYRRSCS